MHRNINITKATGEVLPYERARLLSSLIRSGASKETADKVVTEVEKKIHPGISTQKLWQIARHELRKREIPSSVRYGLKQAIMALGPTGFPFERYVGAILEEYGYHVDIGRTVQGYCVRHEVDVIAKKDEKHFIIEVKYHNQPGIRSDVKVALYVWARYQDIRRAWEQDPRHENEFHQPWLITNTKCTSGAIQFGECAGLRIISWSYPKEGSLENLIEAKKLYPVTILTSLRKDTKAKLVAANLMLAKDLLSLNLSDFGKRYQIPEPKLKRLYTEARAICE